MNIRFNSFKKHFLVKHSFFIFFPSFFCKKAFVLKESKIGGLPLPLSFHSRVKYTRYVIRRKGVCIDMQTSALLMKVHV